MMWDKFANIILFWNYVKEVYPMFHQEKNKTKEQLDIRTNTLATGQLEPAVLKQMKRDLLCV